VKSGDFMVVYDGFICCLLVVSNMTFMFPFHIWDVILPIDFNSIIVQRGYFFLNHPPDMNASFFNVRIGKIDGSKW
jgi:hypothetical protein